MVLPHSTLKAPSLGPGTATADRRPMLGRPMPSTSSAGSVRTTTAPARPSAASMVFASRAMPTCPRPDLSLPRKTRSPGSTSLRGTGCVVANSWACDDGRSIPADPYTADTSEPQLHDFGPLVPGAYGRPSASMAALTASIVSRGSTSRDVGRRGGRGGPGRGAPPAEAAAAGRAGPEAAGSSRAAAGGGLTPAAVSEST